MPPKAILTPGAPRPLGHYSQAVAANGFLFISGQLPFDAATGELRLGPIEEQTRLVLRNLDAILRAAGCAREDVVKVTLFFPDMALWPAINKAYAEFFGEHRPARSAVPSGPLHYNAGLEIEAIAALPGAAPLDTSRA